MKFVLIAILTIATPAIADEKLNSEEIQFVEGTWVNHKRMGCLSGQTPLDRSDVELSLSLQRDDSDSGGIQIQADKKVKSIQCTFFLPEAGHYLIESSYIFEINRLSEMSISEAIESVPFASSQVNSASGVQNILQSMLQAGVLSEDQHFTLRGIKNLKHLVNESDLILCDPLKYFFVLKNIIHNYHVTELNRDYVIQFADGEMQVFFKEDLICPDDIAYMVFDKTN